MARTDTLGNFLTDIADAIREKNGTTDTIYAASFDEEIKNLPTGGGDEELATSYLSSIDDTLGQNTTKLPNGITSIGDYAFYGRSNLALTSLPNSITSIGDYAFDSCGNLALTSLPSNLLKIGQRAFSYCSNLAVTNLPDTLITLSDYAFQSCFKLKITSIPAGVIEIPSYCFRYCNSLTEITMHGNITVINNYAFQSCNTLAKIVFPNVTGVPTLSNVNAFNYTPIETGTGYIYVPDSLVDSFKSATNWSTYADQIKPLSELEEE